LSGLVEQLARAAVDHRNTKALEDARDTWAALRPAMDRCPEKLLASVLRLPDPFYRFDQSVEDCRELVRRFAEKWPERGRPILLLGIRTSGTYLAPLYRALLLDVGYRQVDSLTVRPRQHWRRREVARVRAVGASGGLVVITDDPPATGNAVARVAADVEQHGVPREAVAIVLPLFGPESSLPESLRPFASVVLPWRDWSIHAGLAPESVRHALTKMLVGQELVESGTRLRVAAVREVERIDDTGREAAAGRRHASSRYRARVEAQTGERFELKVVVTGLGSEYYCARARALASVLGAFVETPLGIEGGLLYEREVAAETRVRFPISEALEDKLVSYVAHRHEALEIEADPSVRTPEDQMVWRMAADALGTALGGPFRALVYPVTHLASRRLLSVQRPSLTDGNLTLSSWCVAPGGPDGARKTDWLGRLSCYDAAFDLASAAASADVEELVLGGGEARESLLGERLLERYRRRTGEEIDSERWLLYELVENSQRLAYLGREVRAGHDGDETAHASRRETMRRLLATRRALAKEHQRYISEVFFSDVVPSKDGPLCALDVDWVLETKWLDFPAISPAGALALRALLRHGYRPVIVTARSLGEVRDRCRLYRLPGGVAELGSVLYNLESGQVVSQLHGSERGELVRLREELEKLPDVFVEQAHEHSVRAVRLTTHGSVRGLEEYTIQAALDAADLEGRVRIFRGGGQTDFVTSRVHKGTGLRALAGALGADPDEEHPVAFAMGDDWPDSPMFDLARARFAPANVSDELRKNLSAWPDLTVTRDPYGSGVLQAVTAFLGHNPRRCDVCAPPSLSRRQKVLVTALGGLDGPRRTRARRVLALAATLLAS
jgi:hydroxymethylpyrimidine pyrophosphatase-like HAD family hydrolase